MSRIDDAFSQSRIDFGLQQKPNWNGTVYGACQTRNCGNHHKVGYYEGGFCKLCSVRYPDDKQLPVLSGNIGSSGYNTTIPNPQIRWRDKLFVKDLSHHLSGSERSEFYMTPEQLANKRDNTSYRDRFDPDDGIVEAKPSDRKGLEAGDWVE